MQRKYFFTFLIAAGALLVTASGIWLATANPVSAQCGSAASSCKNCHEVQGEMPVNNDGTAWHTSHAFGDFCYICHAGNQQATDEAGAHTGMVPPLSDIKASCMQCHPADLQERAQVYATALGVELGSGTTTDATTPPAADNAPVEFQTESSTPITTSLEVNDPNLVDFIQNYDQVVLGKFPTNWGNVILIVMIGLLTIGGGGFVIVNEKLVTIVSDDTELNESEYSKDVLNLLPTLANLDHQDRKSLKNFLDNFKKSK